VRVRDTGIGIPPGRLGDIFELFTQLDADRDRKLGGLGIGLTLVKRLTELHGGSVVALSDGPGKGSEFIVRLPRQTGQPAAAEPQAEPAPRPRQLMLVIDDNHDTRDVLAMSLQLEGQAVLVAGSAREGLEIALAERPAVVIVDIGLPDISGYEVAQRLRQALGRDTILIAFSGYGQPDDRRRSLEAGFDAHVVKPATGEAILSVVARHAAASPPGGD
jgi:two-component system CheB/CheR fusion protein